MNTQEKQVIDEIFTRLKNVADQPRDTEVEHYITSLIKAQPYAPYALAQSVYVQEQALINAHQEIEALKAENTRLAAQSQQSNGGGFLSTLFGGGQSQGRSAVPSYGQRQPTNPYGQQPMQPQTNPNSQTNSGPWGQPAQQRGGMGSGGGMGFLGTAAAAAAGVAGGMVIGNMLSSAFGGGQAHAATGGGGAEASTPTNLFDGTAPQREPESYGPSEDYGPHADDFGGGDFGGGDGGGDY